MPDDPKDTQAQRMPDGKPSSDGPAVTPQATSTGTVKSQDGPMDRSGSEAGGEGVEPMTNEPAPVAEDDPGVGLSGPPEEEIEGNRGM